MPLRRTAPARSSKPLRRGKPLRSTPPLRTPLEDVCRELVTARSGGRCETCQKPGTDMSHRRRRAITAWCPCSLLLQCRGCHEWLHAHPNEAEGLGWLVRSWQDPAAVTVLLARVGRVQLACDGSWRRVPDPLATCARVGEAAA